MARIKNLTCYFFMLVAMGSCINDVVLPTSSSAVMILNGLLKADMPVDITFYQTSAENKFVPILNANVLLFEDEILVDTLINNGKGHYSLQYKIKCNHRYLVKVFENGELLVWAETLVPQSVGFSRISNGIERYSGARYPFFLELAANDTTTGYYWLAVSSTDRNPNDGSFNCYASKSLYSNAIFVDDFNRNIDPLASKYPFEYSKFIHFTIDKNVNDTIGFDFLPINSTIRIADTVFLYKTDVHYSLYLKSLLSSFENPGTVYENGPPLYQNSAYLYSNVVNGGGIFGSYVVEINGFLY